MLELPELTIALVDVCLSQEIPFYFSLRGPLRLKVPFLFPFPLFHYFYSFLNSLLCVGSTMSDYGPRCVESRHRALVLVSSLCWFHRTLCCDGIIVGVLPLARHESVAM